MAGGRFQASAKRLLGTTEKSASRRITEMGNVDVDPTLRWFPCQHCYVPDPGVLEVLGPQAPHNQPR